MKNIVFPEDRPILTYDGLELPKGRYIKADEAYIYGLSLQEWGVLFFEGIVAKNASSKQYKDLRQFFCGSVTTQWRVKNKLEERGLL